MAKSTKSVKLNTQNLTLIIAVLAFAIAGVALLRSSFASPLQTGSCTLAYQGAQLFGFTASQLSPSTQYVLTITGTNGQGVATTVTTDTTGNITYTQSSSAAGTVSAILNSEVHGRKVVASCSTTTPA